MNDSGHLRGSGSLRAYSLRLVALMRAHRRLVVALAALSVFLVLLARILAGDIMALDRAAYALIVENLRAGWLTPIMEGFSALATPVVLVTLLLVIAAFAPGARPGWCCALNLALSTVVNLVLKALVARPRPEGFRLAQASGFSFPSGHSMAAMAFFGLIIWFVWRYERNPRMRAGLTAAFSFIILMIGVSRVYLGVHYASDVVGGFCAALIWLALYTRMAVPLFMGVDGASPDLSEGGGESRSS